MATATDQPPVLSTHDSIDPFQPASHLASKLDQHSTHEEVFTKYEIDRTVSEIRRGKWRRVALQFSDELLVDAPTVYEALCTALAAHDPPANSSTFQAKTRTKDRGVVETGAECTSLVPHSSELRLYILGDTSYGACCVDEIAAEHVDADVVVHYGRACLSPTARLPVIYVFTVQPLAIDSVIGAFQQIFYDTRKQIVLMADVSYSHHLPSLVAALTILGYINLHVANVVHDPSSPLPNRTVPNEVREDPIKLKQWHVFHISQPPDSLLLIMSSRVCQMHIFSTSNEYSNLPAVPLSFNTELALRRRYALLTSVSSASIFGILINTLSVKNYLHMVERVKRQIVAAGKKYYTMVVGKVNAAKMANFSEIEGWVVIGCWESSLIENKDLWKPVITPFELELALRKVDERVWTGKWISDFQSVLEEPEITPYAHEIDHILQSPVLQDKTHDYDDESEPESSPPEFDLRTGRFVSTTRPLQPIVRSSSPAATSKILDSIDRGGALVKRHNAEVATIGGEASPGAEFLKSKRTWKGLGSDFEIAYDDSDTSLGALLEEGRKGIARGYTIGSETSRR